MPVLKPKDQEFLRTRFAETLVTPVRMVLFTRETGGVVLPGHPDPRYLELTRLLLADLAALSDRLELEVHDIEQDRELAGEYRVDKIPATVLVTPSSRGVRFFGLPAGYELATLVEDLADLSSGTTRLAEPTRREVKALSGPLHIQVFVTPTCPYCPHAVRLAHQMAMENQRIVADMVEVTAFPDLADRYGVMGVPKIVINDAVEFEGALPEPAFLAHVKAADADARPGGASQPTA